MSGPPLHQHTREDEVFYVFDGYLWFQIDDKRLNAKYGVKIMGPPLGPFSK